MRREEAQSLKSEKNSGELALVLSLQGRLLSADPVDVRALKLTGGIHDMQNGLQGLDDHTFVFTDLLDG